MLVLVLVLMGLTALAASVAPQPEPARVGPSVGPAPSPATATEAAPAGKPQTVERSLSADLGAPEQRVRARVGDTISLEVTGDVLDSVLIPGLDRMETLAPSSPAVFEILADRPGEFPITLLEAKRPIGELVVTPAS